MTQIATVTAVPAPGVALVSVARQTACGHDCEICRFCEDALERSMVRLEE